MQTKGPRSLLASAVVLAAAIATASPPEEADTGACISREASAQPGAPERIAHGEPDPDEHFPFAGCPAPPGIEPS